MNIPWNELTSEQLYTLRINAQVCTKCGKTVGENKSKYCGDGSNKDDNHCWANPMESSAKMVRFKLLKDLSDNLKNEMFSAENAKAAADKFYKDQEEENKKYEERIFNQTIKFIKDFADRGKYSMLAGEMTSKTLAKLKDLGFKVKVDNNSEDGRPYILISWGKDV